MFDEFDFDNDSFCPCEPELGEECPICCSDEWDDDEDEDFNDDWDSEYDDEEVDELDFDEY
jgi:hypothetical protein